MGDTAERLMDLAESRIREAGYNSYSFRDLAAELGIKSSSVHWHFPTKSALTAAVMRRYTDRVLAAVDDATARGVGAVAAYHDVFRTTLRADGFICLGGALGAETGALPPEVADAAHDFFERITADLARRIGGRAAKARAHSVIATLEGAMILARALGDTAAFDRATASLLT
ncbi:TetR/AcrR family transcriptional regulator [Mycobacterium paraterrae]|uniref:TetR/AcrR family transcriptional regulator n=1 Tax=Mycobacterium paraterrae TaxID=577492 RepID=A0ABY3VQ07_9MYCO|nr:TetR/AcrR family transcriptional regulator [Mycobacterium paraterrae]UMB69573.1 TetR/AcrR family transcriptional regulator [Mycobacterium paraterrae]